jgi:hypothetical protein
MRVFALANVIASHAMETLLVFGVLLVLSANGNASADDVVQIPLKSIWAHGMPRTRDVRELEMDAIPPNQRAPLSDDIGGALEFIPQGQTTAKGFAVVGTSEKDALSNAHAVFANKQKAPQFFSTDANIFVVFFSHSFGQYVHLDKVERREKTIKIAYHFVPHETKQMTAHFALIPLGKLPVGKYRVDIVRLPLEQKYVEKGFKSVDSQWNNRAVCLPFSFEIVK